jgi:hypothetical protein
LVVKRVQILFALLVACASTGYTAPKVLIVQTRVPFQGKDDPNVPIANLLAGQFDEAGRCEAIVYSMTDPAIRTAILNGTLSKMIDKPTNKDGHALAKTLGTDYLILIQAFKENSKCRAKLELFRGEKSIWKDDQNVQITIQSKTDAEDMSRSLASTLMARMNQEPLKGLAPKPVIPTPPPDKGQTPVPTKIQPAPETKKDNSALLKKANDWIAAGKASMAVVSLRDAVDADPLDAELRVALVSALMEIKPAEAAAAARTAANLLPEENSLRVLAARAWMRAGMPDEAQKDLNEAVARDPEAMETRLLLAEVALRQSKPEIAIEHLAKAIAIKDTGDARFEHALALAMTGKDPKPDLEALAALEPASLPIDNSRRYALAVEVLDQGFQLDSNEVRSLVQRAIVKPDDKQLPGDVDRLMLVCKQKGVFAAALKVSSSAAKANDRRILALKLLAQSLSGIQAFLGGGGDDALSGARLDLGEAIRNQQEAKG